MRRLGGLFLIGVGSLVWVRTAWAGVMINEVYPNPDTALGEDEWIELYNPDATTANLKGFGLDDIANGGTAIYWLGDVSIGANGFLVIEKQQSHIGLNNGGDEVRLLTSEQQEVDRVGFAALAKGKSWGRTDDGSGDWTVMDAVTKGASNREQLSATNNALPVTTNSPVVLRLSEVMACPSSGVSEWVEIYNQNESGGDIADWTLIDAKGNKREIQGTIKGHGYMVVELPSALLNNEGDTVKLVNNQSELIDEMSYAECIGGTSWIRVDGSWQLTTKPTAGSVNILEAAAKTTLTTPREQTSVKEAGVVPNSPEANTGTTQARTTRAGERTVIDEVSMGSASGQLPVASVAGIIDRATLSAQLRNAGKKNEIMESKAAGYPRWLIFAGMILLTIGGWPWLKQVGEGLIQTQ